MRTILYNLATDKYRGCIPGLIKVFLLILSFAYGLAVRMLMYLCRLRPYRLKCKVISVGNITLGGTGKTTVVEFLTRYLKQNGHKVAILSRGYKRKVTSQASQVTSEAMGDEPYMLAKSLGDVAVLVDKDRIRSGNRAVREHGADTVILDDGFQQWRLAKDLEIVAIDAANPFGNRQLLPRGILREPLSCLARADVFILTKTNLGPDIKGTADLLSRLNPTALIVESRHVPVCFYELGTHKGELLDPQQVKGKTVALVSGIGDPGSFEAVMEGLGVSIGLSFRFADHHTFSRTELETIAQRARSKNIDTVVTTEKDAARLDGLGAAMRILVLRIALQITKNEREFFSRLLKLYSL